MRVRSEPGACVTLVSLCYGGQTLGRDRVAAIEAHPTLPSAICVMAYEAHRGRSTRRDRCVTATRTRSREGEVKSYVPRRHAHAVMTQPCVRLCASVQHAHGRAGDGRGSKSVRAP